MKRTRARRAPERAVPAPACSDYAFRQRFRVPAAWAFRWCVDFGPDDTKLSTRHSSRKVLWLSPGTVTLDDTFRRPSGERVRKVKLVQIYPSAKYWVSTHIAGPNHHSQFRYTILPDGRNASFLVFEGRDLAWEGRPLSEAANRERAERLRSEDAEFWKRLAVRLERDYSER